MQVLFSSLFDLVGCAVGGESGLGRSMWVSPSRQRRGRRTAQRRSWAARVLRCPLPACLQTRRAPPVHLVLPVLLVPVPVGAYVVCPALSPLLATPPSGARKALQHDEGLGQVVLACVVVHPPLPTHPATARTWHGRSWVGSPRTGSPGRTLPQGRG